MNIDLMKLFEGYVRNYHTLNLTNQHGKHSFTMTEIEYFSRLGSMMGYFSFTEDTCNGENRPMDLTWWDNMDDEGWNNFELHLERENLFEKDHETLEKLFCTRDNIPENVIGILNVKSVERVEELVSIAKTMCNSSNALLIFRTNSEYNNKGYFDEVYAYLLNQDEIISIKRAFVSELGNILFMHFEPSLQIGK